MFCCFATKHYLKPSRKTLAVFAGDHVSHIQARQSSTNFFLFVNAVFSFNTFVLIEVQLKLASFPCCSRKHSMSLLQGSPWPTDSIHFLK